MYWNISALNVVSLFDGGQTIELGKSVQQIIESEKVLSERRKNNILFIYGQLRTFIEARGLPSSSKRI